MVTKDYQPLSIVDNQGFLKYSQTLQPLYKPTNRKRLSTVILQRFYIEAASILKIMLLKIGNIAVTTDIWTSDSNIAYIT